MKRFLVLIVCVAMFAIGLAGCMEKDSAPSEPIKVGIVDSQRVFLESRIGKEGMAQLQEMNMQMQQELQALQQEQQNQTSEVQDTKVQEAFNAYRNSLQAAQNRIFGEINEAYTKAIAEYREKNNLAVIIPHENVLAYAKDVDITQKIIDAMNAVPQTPSTPASGNATTK